MMSRRWECTINLTMNLNLLTHKCSGLITTSSHTAVEYLHNPHIYNDVSFIMRERESSFYDLNLYSSSKFDIAEKLSPICIFSYQRHWRYSFIFLRSLFASYRLDVHVNPSHGMCKKLHKFSNQFKKNELENQQTDEEESFIWKLTEKF